MLKRIFTILLGLLLLFSLAGCREKEKDKDDKRQPDGGQAASSQTMAPIFWNIDQDLYYDPETQTSTRRPAPDGLYRMRFLLNGTQVTLSCANRALVDQIDARQYMGFILRDLEITEILDPSDMCIVLADGFYVMSIDGNTYYLNPAQAINYYPDIEVTEQTRIYDVSPDAENYGELTELGIMDKVVVLQNTKKGPAQQIFVTQRPIKAEVLWRVDETPGQVSTWDEEKQCTTRVPDENGVYTIPMAKDGQQVDVLCKDIEIVNKIDSLPVGKQAIGLHFDDAGFADLWVTPAKAVLGTLQADQWDVTAIEGDDISVLCNIPSSTQGASDTFRLAPDCRIYDTTGSSGPVGVQVDSLQVGDRVMLLCNADREIVIAYITQRSLEN